MVELVEESEMPGFTERVNQEVPLIFPFPFAPWASSCLYTHSKLSRWFPEK